MLKQGLVKMADVDRAVGNVLRQKFAAGLFDKNDTLLYVDAARHQAVVGAAPHRELARTVAEEGVTLLKNDRLRLPLLGLGKDIKIVAVIGPNADNQHSHLGIYGTDKPAGGVRTVLNATTAAANASGNAWVVNYEVGSCLGGTPGCPCSSDLKDHNVRIPIVLSF
jgi:beta-glucosidase